MRGRGSRLARVVPGVVLVVVPLAGCATEQEAYCDAVAERQEALTEIAADRSPGALLDALPLYRELREEAPSDIRAEWDTVVDRLTALEESLRDAGVDPATWDPKQTPEELTEEERGAITDAGRDLGAPETLEAMSGIEQHALDVCKSPLSR